MKKAVLGLVVAVMVVAAGCASTGGASDPAVARLAKQLAAAINAIEAGKAVVSGDTVTLTGWIRLENAALTVPAGITLDLTMNGAALELRDGAVLTVEGTVNANSDRVRLEGNPMQATINGTGNIRLSSKGRLLEVGGNRKLTLDGVTLVGLPDNVNSLIGINEGGELVMKSGAITGNTRASDDWASGGGVNMYKGTFVMEGGEISGNSAVGSRGSGGGGVQVGEASVFTMSGGAIAGNRAQGGENGSGGGVEVHKGTFYMSGGAISGNTASGKENSGGGGVAISGESVFTMSGGEISGNTITSGTNGCAGGGVNVNPGTAFTMKGGEISGNRIVGTRGASGGVQARGTFIMEGGTIYGRNAEGGKANDGPGSSSALNVPPPDLSPGATAKWGIGGTYTKGGVPQSGGTDIGTTHDTLIAVPAR